jgi:hypothetical protein
MIINMFSHVYHSLLFFLLLFLLKKKSVHDSLFFIMKRKRTKSKIFHNLFSASFKGETADSKTSKDFIKLRDFTRLHG